jgi:hypothetical protein
MGLPTRDTIGITKAPATLLKESKTDAAGRSFPLIHMELKERTRGIY